MKTAKKRIIVMLDDDEIQLGIYKDLFRRLMPAAPANMWRCFTDDRQAQRFILRHKKEITGIVQDLVRINSLEPGMTAGLAFIKRVIIPMQPRPRTLVVSGQKDIARCLALCPDKVHFRMVLKPPDYLLLEKYFLWLLGRERITWRENMDTLQKQTS